MCPECKIEIHRLFSIAKNVRITHKNINDYCPRRTRGMRFFFNPTFWPEQQQQQLPTEQHNYQAFDNNFTPNFSSNSTNNNNDNMCPVIDMIDQDTNLQLAQTNGEYNNNNWTAENNNNNHNEDHEQPAKSTLFDCYMLPAPPPPLIANDDRNNGIYKVLRTDQVFDLMHCPYCKKAYRDPRLLHCGHTYCLECLVQMNTDTKFIKCMKCEATYAMTSDRVHTFPKNLIVADMQAIPTFEIDRGETFRSTYKCLEEFKNDLKHFSGLILKSFKF